MPRRLLGQNMMPLKSSAPIIYLITSGETTSVTTTASKDYLRILNLVEAAVAAKVNLLQLREKNLSARVLYELTIQAVQLVKDTNTQLLVNDRADIGRAAGADGVHLTARSIDARIVRETFGSDFLIGVSTHSESEARRARDENATFAVYGPVFETTSKRIYGEPVGVGSLHQSVLALQPFPLLALGGITLENVRECFRAGAAGIAGIGLFQDRAELGNVVERIREVFAEATRDGPTN